MKKILLGAALALMSAVSFAGTPGSDSNAVSDRMVGKTATSYSDAYFGSTTCNETQHPKFDTVSCTLANPSSLAGTSGTIGWYSDFNNAKLGTFTYTVSPDGLTYSGQATY